MVVSIILLEGYTYNYNINTPGYIYTPTIVSQHTNASIRSRMGSPFMKFCRVWWHFVGSVKWRLQELGIYLRVIFVIDILTMESIWNYRLWINCSFRLRFRELLLEVLIFQLFIYIWILIRKICIIKSKLYGWIYLTVF